MTGAGWITAGTGADVTVGTGCTTVAMGAVGVVYDGIVATGYYIAVKGLVAGFKGICSTYTG